MDTQMQSNKPLHPLAWAAGIAVILFSAVGIGAFMGWIPTSMGNSGDKSVAQQASETGFPAPAKSRASAVPAQKTPAKTANNSSAETKTSTTSTVTPVIPASPVAARCADCGVIESVREVETKGAGSGLGAVGGAVLGGVLGNQVGAGRGQDAMTVIGAVGGGLAGNEVEKRVKSTKSYAITIRFDDGSSRTISQSNASTWRAGDKVKVVNGVIQSNA